jgi:hypothetical protein
MDIQILSQYSLRLKGKRATFVVDPSSIKASESKSAYAAALVLARPFADLEIQSEAVVIDRPGEYEIGGIKMNSTRSDAGIVYNPVIDGVELLLGTLSTLDKMQHKLKEQHVVVVHADIVVNASFITSLASNVVIFYGKHAKEAAGSFGKENVQTVSKYVVTLEKLPQEVETVVLE